MKRAILLLAATAVALGLASGMALEATIVGNPWSETLTGTAKGDNISGMGGGDALIGKGGNDFLHSVGDNAGDLVDCGSGTDTVQTGSDQKLDRFVNCERFVR